MRGSMSIHRGSQYPLIILDEFQDTNEDEWRFIRALTRHSQVLALADPEQRIYEFRGASALRIQEFEDIFRPAFYTFGAENHRSVGTDIVQFGNDLLTGVNRGRTYANVTVKSYVPRKGQLHKDFKFAVLAAIARLNRGGGDWSLSAVERKAGCTGDGSVQRFFVKPSLSGQVRPSTSLSGLGPITGSSAPKEAVTRPLYAHLRSSGFGFCTGAGKPGRLTMKPSI